MNKVILDTDILSEIFRARSLRLLVRSNAYLAFWGHLTVSVITVFEVVKGHRMRLSEDRIEAFLDSIEGVVEILPVNFPIAVLAGRIFGDLERTGQTIGRSDPMIDAVAIEHGLTLVTGNTDHFRRIQALGYPLVLDDWRQD